MKIIKKMGKYLFGFACACMMVLALYGRVEAREAVDLQQPELEKVETLQVSSTAVQSIYSKYSTEEVFLMAANLVEQHPTGSLVQIFYLNANTSGKTYEIPLKGKSIKAGKNFSLLTYDVKAGKWTIAKSAKSSSGKVTFKIKGKKTCPAAICEFPQNKDMTLNKSSLSLQTGKTSKIVKVTLKNDSIKSVTSSDKTKKIVASAKASGKTIVIKAGSKAGKATITVTSKSGIKKTVKVTVTAGKSSKSSSTKLTLSSTNVVLSNKGAEKTVTATVTPAKEKKNLEVKVTSGTEVAYAEVDSNGVITITALKKGNATVTVSVGKVKKTISVVVNDTSWIDKLL